MTKKEKRLHEKHELREYLKIEDERVLDSKASKIELVSDDEVFVLVNQTKNYWISNCGRLINNLKNYFYIHKGGNAHYTLSGYDNDLLHPFNTYCDKLVAEHFLEKPTDCNRIWHIDRDIDNCFYRNLVWVSNKEYLDLSRNSISVDVLGRQQKYVPYITMKGNAAYSIWNGIYKRCYMDSHTSYDGSIMCESWKKHKDAFAEWYLDNYYECAGESMAVDKDLLCPGNKEYAADKCCILPQTLNTMLSNCKKHRSSKWRSTKMNLPLGVRYDERIKKYRGEIKPFGHDELISLSYWDTPEEAFGEYKRFKQADILMMSVKYKNRIPKHVYEALLKVEVEPY